jgi:hypothetical protein
MLSIVTPCDQSTYSCVSPTLAGCFIIGLVVWALVSATQGEKGVWRAFSMIWKFLQIMGAGAVLLLIAATVFLVRSYIKYSLFSGRQP